jgi:hypothetical protein
VTGSRIAVPARDAMSERKVANDAAAATVPQAQSYRTFLSRLQDAVRANDRRAVIRLIGFPLRVNAPGGARIYRDGRSVERDFDQIFTANVRRAVLRQRADRLFVRDLGAMVGSGQLWFDQRSPAGPVVITAVNP